MRAGPVSRVTITEAAAAVLQGLIDHNGPVMFHQSGGCCDGSSPMCYPLGEFRVGAAAVILRPRLPATPGGFLAAPGEY
ncbi:DUF779 domain-containing protein, partial [Nocardia tengchongensis]|uniref:DUF779 domain-containing protein n=1 Tax=Nocardia tengchongensis TaxID=2055889 RepID=UPI003679DBE0